MAEDTINSYIDEVEKPIDYKYYIFLVRKKLYVVLTFFIITVTIASIYAAKGISDKYTTYAQIIVERPQRAALDAQSVGVGLESASWKDDYYLTQEEIMRGVGVMRHVVKELNLTSYFGIADSEKAAKKVASSIRIHRVKDSRLFNIHSSTKDPQFTARLANAVARAYIRVNFENRLHYSQELLNWLPEEGAPDELVTIETPYGKVKQVTRSQLLESLPALQTNPTLRELREKKSKLEADLEFNLKRFREKHPTIVKQRTNLKFLNETIEVEKKNILEGLRSKAEGRHQIGYARIIEEAPVPTSPIKQDRLMIVVIAAVAQLVISILLIVIIDFFDDTVRSVEDMERKGLILPFLGPISIMKGQQPDKRALVSFHDKTSDIAESFRYLRVAINFSASPEDLKNLIITSCLPSEGKSFVSHNLAISLALDGNKTLLVDCDLRRPVLHQAFSFENAVGISNYLTSDIQFEDVVKDCFVDNLHVVGSGPISPNPGEILGSSKMKKFLEEAQKKYDRIIIDCPPLTGLGDGFVVGSLIGHVIMVIASGKTPAELVKRTQSQLDKAGIKILGTVLNFVDMEKERYGGYYKYYYHTYNRYYQQP